MKRSALAPSIVVAAFALVVTTLSCAAFKSGSDNGSGGGSGGSADGGVDRGNVPATSCTATKERSFMPLGEATKDSYWAGIAPAGDQMGVVWEAPGASTSTLYFARIDNLGKPSGTKNLGAGQDPVLRRDGADLALFYRDGDTVYVRHLDDSGSFTTPATKVYGPTNGFFSVAWLGDGYAMGLDGAESLPYEVHLLRTDASGAPLDAPQRVPTMGNNSVQPAIAFDGATATISLAWTDMREGTPAVYFATFDKSGKRKTDDLRLSDSGVRGSFPTVSAQALGGTVVCYEQRVTTNNQEIYCTRLDDSAKVTNQTRITQTALDSLNPHAYQHGRLTWLIWDDNDGTAPSANWQFLDENGTPILTQPKALGPGYSAWRTNGYVAKDGLYFSQYHTDDEIKWNAEFLVLNCF